MEKGEWNLPLLVSASVINASISDCGRNEHIFASSSGVMYPLPSASNKSKAALIARRDDPRRHTAMAEASSVSERCLSPVMCGGVQ
jgi:hypothetical protein